MDDAIAVRRYTATGGNEVTITLGRPYQRGDGHYAVDVTVDGLDQPYRQAAPGFDAFQALRAALLQVDTFVMVGRMPQ